MNLPHQMNFLVIAVPGVIAALAIFLVNLQASVEGSSQVKTPNIKAQTIKNTAN